jgi:2-aminoadipate transaminase
MDTTLHSPPLARRMRRVSASAIMELLKTTAGGNYISFASGLPDPTLFPTQALAEITAEVLAEDSQQALQYGPAEGHPPLRARVAEMLRQRGFADATPDHVLITHGSQQALDLAARAFLNPGDPVLIETPSYLAAMQIFDSHEAQYLPVPLDTQGMDVEQAEVQIKEGRPRLLYTLPDFQNPTGITQSLARRQRLATLAAQHALPVLEDDAYYDLRYEGDPLPPVAALAPNPLAVYTGTFSKTIAPGLRVGYLYAQPPLVTCLAHLKQLTDLQASSFTQRVVLRFCERGLLEPQIALLQETYRARRDVLLEALADLAPGVEGQEMRWTHPAGGMFVFVTLPQGMDAAALLPAAMERGVVYVPGASFYPDAAPSRDGAGGGANTLRLNFVSANEDAIRRGIRLLIDTLRGTTL